MLRSIRIVLFSLLLTISLAGSVTADCPVGDLNGDCQVNLQDLELLAEQWLVPPRQTEGGPRRTDLNGDEEIGTADFALLAKDWYRVGIPLVINEVLASNSTGIRDPQGQYDDWIEIHNTSDEAIDVGGMYLTDDLDNPTMWQIPDDNPSATTIPAHEYLVIWADDDTTDPGLHANFKLDAAGEQIGLFDSDGPASGGLIDIIAFGDQTADISYGRYPNGSRDLRYMAFPTPGAENIGVYLGFVADTKFSHDRGLYDEQFDLTITTETEGAIIYYTLDGTEPYQIGGRFPTGRVYTGPIPITKTTCLRAIAIKFGWKSSNVDTQTYIFLDYVVHQPTRPAGFPSSWGSTSADYEMDPEIVNGHNDTIKDDLKSLPTMSLVMNLTDLFDSSKGIYANPYGTGVAWERPGSIELIYPDGAEGFQADCGVRIYGGVGRREKKKTFRVLFKGIYGPTRLQYPLFGQEAADTFDTIILRANFNDGYPFGKDCTQHIRDEYVRRLQLALGHPSPHGTFVHLYVNGLYWGLYNPVERPQASFAANYFGGDKEDWDALNSGQPAGGSNLSTWNAMINLVRQGLQTNEAYQRLQGNNPDGTPNPDYVDYLDIPNYIDYMIINFFVGNTDWPGHNWYAAMNHVDSTGWKSFSWDAEWVIGLIVGHGLDSYLNENCTGVGNSLCEPYARLRSNKEFRLLFADHVHRAFFNGGPLYVDAYNSQWNPQYPERNRPAALYAELADLVERAMITESARWGDVGTSTPYNINQWRSQRDWILHTYMPQRSSIVLNQLRSANLYPEVDAPVFYINGWYTHGGQISRGDNLTMVNPDGSGSLYYTVDGADPHTSGTSGGSIISSTTIVTEDADKRVLVPAGPISDDWKGGGAFDDSAWALSAGSPGGVGYERNSGYESLISIDIGDQMYSENASCYIRIPFTVDADDLAGFNFMTLEIRYDDGFVVYINGAEADRRNFTGTPAWNSQASTGNADSAAVMFESIGISDHIGDLRSGNNILAIHGLNISTTSSDLLISVKLIAGKSSSPGGAGIAPTAIKYTGPTTLTETTQVKARVVSGSTWSALKKAVFAIGPVAENLRITEIMYHPQDTNDPNDPNEEFIELQNVGTEAINLNLVRFTNGVDFTFPDTELAAGEYVLVVKDINAFAAQYGIGFNIAGQYSGNLRNGGERVELQDAAGQSILNFRYRDGWYDITDGMGFSLTVKDPISTEPNAWNDKSTWRPSANIGGSPGWDDTDEVPALGSVKINELLAHSHAAASDWIELYNTTTSPIHIGGWFFSDDSDDLMKYEIADGTWIDPCGYIVFYQNQHFGNIAAPGCHSSFALSENGETLYLHSGRDGVLTGYSEEEKFDASETGVAFGRYRKSTGTYNFVAMTENTPGSANAYPKVGPIVINEIMYHPQNNGDAEYVELLNISGGSVVLQEWDNEQGKDVPWRFTDEGGISFDFLLGTTMAAGEYILLVRNLSAFESEFGAVGGGVQVFEWELGKLDNGSEKIQLSKPGDEVEGERYYIRVDRVNYSDGSHPVGGDPWPSEADGAGSSLVRKEPEDYGNDITNWKAASGSPGDVNS